jgi:hypothetical protein
MRHLKQKITKPKHTKKKETYMSSSSSSTSAAEEQTSTSEDSDFEYHSDRSSCWGKYSQMIRGKKRKKKEKKRRRKRYFSEKEMAEILKRKMKDTEKKHKQREKAKEDLETRSKKEEVRSRESTEESDREDCIANKGSDSTESSGDSEAQAHRVLPGNDDSIEEIVSAEELSSSSPLTKMRPNPLFNLKAALTQTVRAEIHREQEEERVDDSDKRSNNEDTTSFTYTLKIGQTFPDFHSFKEKRDSEAQKGFTVLVSKDTLTWEKDQTGIDTQRFPYQHAEYSCCHGGQYKPRGRNIRPHQSS